MIALWKRFIRAAADKVDPSFVAAALRVLEPQHTAETATADTLYAAMDRMIRASRASREESEEALFPVMNTLGQVKTEVFKGVRDRDADWIKSVKSGLDPDDFRSGCSDIDPDRVVVGAVVKVGIIDEGTEWIWVKVSHVGSEANPEANNPDTIFL
jgi:hypothetical protein